MDFSQRSPDWVISNNSNVNVARDRSWFITYVAFETHVETTHTSPSQNMAVVGIGTVKIHVMKSRSETGLGISQSIILENVLHAPGAVCNILGSPFLYNFEAWNVREGTLLNSEGQVVMLLDRRRGGGLAILKLCSGQAGPSTLDEDTMYCIYAHWPMKERARYNSFQSQALAKPDPKPSHEKSKVAPYTEAEKRFLKTHYRDEYHFLLMYGLKIYDEEDREEGRLILRGLMKAREEEEKAEKTSL